MPHVRAPDERTGLKFAAERLKSDLRGSSRTAATLPAMPRPALVATTCALALVSAIGLTACGGDSRPYDQVPTSTPAIVPPDDANDVASGTGTNTTGTTSTTTTQTDTTATDTGGTGATDTGGTTDTGTGGGTTDTGGTGNTGGTDNTGTGGGTGNTGGATPDTGGASPDQNAGAGSFQKFCADNPGAC